jgi:RNA polymerase sigma factor (sigma-70 family)
VSESTLPSETFEQLAMPHFERLYNFACWLTQDRHEAEDLVQETYAKALKGFSSFQPGTNFRAWIYKILRNTFLTSRTGLKATSNVPLDLEDDEVLPLAKETPESILLQRSDSQLVQRALFRKQFTRAGWIAQANSRFLTGLGARFGMTIRCELWCVRIGRTNSMLISTVNCRRRKRGRSASTCEVAGPVPRRV